AAAAAATTAASQRSPFDEAERATGVRPPQLRLAAGTGLAALAYGTLAAGAADAHLAFGAVGLLRNLVGVVGVTLLTAALGSGNLAWLGTLGYLLLAMTAVSLGWTTPWLWPARPPTDRGAAICAGLVFLAGLAAITIRVGAAEVTRRALSAGDVDRLVRAEIAERESAARDYDRAGRPDRAQRLRAEAAVLSAHLTGP